MSDDDVNYEYYQGIKFATEAAAARIAELEAERDKWHGDAVTQMKHKIRLEDEVARLITGLAEEAIVTKAWREQAEGWRERERLAAARIAELEDERDRRRASASDLVKRMRQFHDEIVSSDGAESGQMFMMGEAADRIAELEGDLVAWRNRAIEAAEDLRVMTARAITNITRDLDAANARVAELEGDLVAWRNRALNVEVTLKPFIYAARAVDASMPGDHEITCIFTASELRAARSTEHDKT